MTPDDETALAAVLGDMVARIERLEQVVEALALLADRAQRFDHLLTNEQRARIGSIVQETRDRRHAAAGEAAPSS